MSPDDDNDHDEGADEGPEFDLDPAMLARAEQAVAAHGGAFRKAVTEQISDMTRLTDALAAPDGTGGESATWNALYEHGHDLAGQGGTFGYPLVSEIGRSLCMFIKARSGETSSGDIAILQAHITATAQAVSDDGAGGDANPDLLPDLHNLVRRHLA